MHGRWSNHGGCAARIVACALATTVGLAATPAAAAPTLGVSGHALMRVKLPKVTPSDAEAKRVAVQERGRSLVDGGDPMSAGIEYDNAAAEWGDPILFMDAADAYLAAAEEERDIETAQAAIERANMALDILYFHLDSAADKNFRLVETADVPDLISRANDLIDRGENLIDEIQQQAQVAEAPAEEAAEPASKSRKPGRIKIISGAALASVGAGLLIMGVAGLGLGAARQNDAEDPTVYGEEYDAVAAKGKRANVIAGVGLALGAVAAGAGGALIYLGLQDKKKAASDDKVVKVGPMFGPELGGVTVSGRF